MRQALLIVIALVGLAWLATPALADHRSRAHISFHTSPRYHHYYHYHPHHGPAYWPGHRAHHFHHYHRPHHFHHFHPHHGFHPRHFYGSPHRGHIGIHGPRFSFGIGF